MQIKIDLPDNLPLTEADVRIEIASGLYRQDSLSLIILRKNHFHKGGCSPIT